MTYHKHYPVGTTYTGTEPPPYVPGRIYDFPPGSPPPLYAPPLSEADTWPSMPAASQPPLAHLPMDPHPAPVARRLPCAPAPRHHGWLYWRLAWLRWDVEALWDDMRYGGGWLGQIAFLCVLAASGAAAVVSALLVYFWLAGR